MSQLASNKKQPDIRFGGFDGDWVEKCVADIGAEFTGGGTPSTQKSTYWNGDIPWLQSSDFDEDDVLNVTPKKYITLRGLQNSATKIISENSIAIVTRVGVGKLAFIPYQFASSQDFLSIGKLNIDNLFAVYVLYLLMKKEGNITQGTSIKGITNQVLLSKKIVFPIVPLEQTTIGNFFKQLDDSIALHKRKHQQTQQLKKAMLTKLFPQKGQNQPEIRLQGFRGDWEEKRLGDLGNTYSGLSGKTKEDFGHGNAKYITYMNVFMNNITSKCMMESIEVDMTQTAVKKGDIFFTTSSETPEEVGMSSVWKYDDENIYLNSFCFGFRLEADIDLNYLAFMLRSEQVRKSISLLAQGISRYNISKKGMMNINVPIPNEKEQTAIGNLLKQLDDTLALQTQQINTLENLKKAFLQKMFV